MGYLYILGTILFTVVGQLVLKWQMSLRGHMPTDLSGKITFLFYTLLNPWVLSALFCAFIASLFWMAAMTKFEVSYAYPFMSLAFVLVLVFSCMFLGELLTWHKVLGLGLIIAGIIVTSISSGA